ncbi:hypothetical protein B9Z55_025960 [Caenorhabditis nigoni]|uniref:Uncharacterized protein n=1 Tax=Caenorhabditis nigoni TaxID=1611254 RepID=A0A2G5T166_9PELO|nr:hypothetical protein B9Z55_025960 [Caenorhabditis nigoni]
MDNNLLKNVKQDEVVKDRPPAENDEEKGEEEDEGYESGDEEDEEELMDKLCDLMEKMKEVPSGLDALKKARMERSLEELEYLIEEVVLSEKKYQEDSDSSLILD